MLKQMKPKFGPGDWFAVPLSDGTWAAGRIARRGGPTLVGYFFGPRRREVPTLAEVASLRPEDAVYVRKFGYLGLREGEWPILGGAEEFDRASWPMPMFGMHDVRGEYWGLIYDENRPSALLRQVRITAEEFTKVPSAGAAGDIFVAEWLDSILPPVDD